MTSRHCLHLNMAEPINSVENVKKAQTFEDRVRIKKAGRPMHMIDFEGRAGKIFNSSYNNACLI